MIKHILLINFKSTAKVSKIDEVKTKFESMPSKIEGVCAVEWGLNDSPEGLNKAYTHAALMTFINALARDYYLPHPYHSELKNLLEPLLEDIIVFDYTV
jgi:hypothetical protein